MWYFLRPLWWLVTFATELLVDNDEGGSLSLPKIPAFFNEATTSRDFSPVSTLHAGNWFLNLCSADFTGARYSIRGA
jgi:hypothetical protein